MNPYKEHQYMMVQFNYFKGRSTALRVPLISGLPLPGRSQYRSELGGLSRVKVGSSTVGHFTQEVRAFPRGLGKLKILSIFALSQKKTMAN